MDYLCTMDVLGGSVTKCWDANHWSQKPGAYVRYDRSIEAQVHAAQRCAGDSNVYEDTLKEETGSSKNKVISGKLPVAEDADSPTKKSKLNLFGGFSGKLTLFVF